MPTVKYQHEHIVPMPQQQQVTHAQPYIAVQQTSPVPQMYRQHTPQYPTSQYNNAATDNYQLPTTAVALPSTTQFAPPAHVNVAPMPTSPMQPNYCDYNAMHGLTINGQSYYNQPPPAQHTFVQPSPALLPAQHTPVQPSPAPPYVQQQNMQPQPTWTPRMPADRCVPPARICSCIFVQWRWQCIGLARTALHVL
jgi:hypothetical protein